MALEQSTVDASGMGALNPMPELMKRERSLTKQREDVSSEEVASAEERKQILKEREAGMAPLRDALSARIKDVPQGEVKEEPIPEYTRPKMDPKELHETFGILMAASMLTGLASRTPYNNVATAMTGAMDGFVKRDDHIVEESLKVFDKNLTVIKEKNAKAKREWDEMWKKYGNDTHALDLQIQLFASKYDFHLDQNAAGEKALSKRAQMLDNNLKSTDTAINRLTQLQQHAAEQKSRMAEANARLAETKRHNKAIEIEAAARTSAAKQKQQPTEPGAVFEKMKNLSPEQDQALRIQAWNYIDTKVLPYRKGSGGGADRNDMVMAMAAKISLELGIPPQELAGKSAKFKADAGSYLNLTKKSDVIEAQLESFHNNLNTWDTLAKGQGVGLGSEKSRELASKLGKVDFTGIKTIDDIRLRIEQEFNDPAAVAVITAASAAAFDYARIMSSQGQSAGQITDSARHEAQILVSRAYNDEARAALMATLDSDTAGQAKGLEDQKKKRYAELVGKEPATPSSTPAATSGPYSDPDKERRYQEWKAKNAPK